MMTQTANSTLTERMTQPTPMKLHFIAIGGSVMHNLALSLAQSGYRISGSDDDIHNPAKDRLAMAGLLPEKMGWFPEKNYCGPRCSYLRNARPSRQSRNSSC